MEGSSRFAKRRLYMYINSVYKLIKYKNYKLINKRNIGKTEVRAKSRVSWLSPLLHFFALARTHNCTSLSIIAFQLPNAYHRIHVYPFKTNYYMHERNDTINPSHSPIESPFEVPASYIWG